MDRERSASSKGSSPIGSISPNSSFVASSGSMAAAIKLRGARSGVVPGPSLNGIIAPAVTVGGHGLVRVGRSSSRGTTSSHSSQSLSPPVIDRYGQRSPTSTSTSSTSTSTQGAQVNVKTPDTEVPSSPSTVTSGGTARLPDLIVQLPKALPPPVKAIVVNPAVPAKKRLSMDIVPVLPTQIAPAQLSPDVQPPSASAPMALPVQSTSPAATPPVPIRTSSSASIRGRNNAAPPPVVPAARPRRVVDPDDSDSEEGAPDGTDEYSYHSTNPTPVNSPTGLMRPSTSLFAAIPTSTGPSSSVSSATATGASAPSLSRLNHKRGASSNSNFVAASLAAGSGSGVDEAREAAEDGTLVSRAAEIVSSARGLFGAIWNAGVGHPASPVESFGSVHGRRSSEG